MYEKCSRLMKNYLDLNKTFIMNPCRKHHKIVRPPGNYIRSRKWKIFTASAVVELPAANPGIVLALHQGVISGVLGSRIISQGPAGGSAGQLSSCCQRVLQTCVSRLGASLTHADRQTDRHWVNTRGLLAKKSLGQGFQRLEDLQLVKAILV